MATVTTIEPTVQWVTASPLWLQSAASIDAHTRETQMLQPALLRFTTDAFMDDFLALLAADPSQLAALRARPETWSEPPSDVAEVKPTLLVAKNRMQVRLPSARPSFKRVTVELPIDSGESTGVDKPLKLFQPAHQRYYLTAGHLVCRLPGLPDRALDTAADERVTFVVRRLLPRSAGVDVDPEKTETFDEYTWVQAGQARVWHKAEAPAKLVPGEEQLPLFPVNYTEHARKRRLLAGMIPVGKRETYQGGSVDAQPAPPVAVNSGALPDDPRILALRRDVLEPWKHLIDRAQLAAAIAHSDTNKDPKEFYKVARDDIQTLSWLVLLDFARFLQQYVSSVWEAIRTNTSPSDLDALGLLNAIKAMTLPAKLPLDANKAFADELVSDTQGHYHPADVVTALDQALKRFDSQQVADNLEGVALPFDRAKPAQGWPRFLFPLSDPLWMVDEATVNALEDKIKRAMPPDTARLAPLPPPSAQAKLDLHEGWFVIRYIFERPACGELWPSLVSMPTQAFQMASFFDPDAPVRPIRVTLPMDTTPAGLRKFAKSATFAMSNVLCGQVEGAGKLTLGDLILSVLPFPFHKDLPSLSTGPCAEGKMCSLSIPIITLCAFILLMIFVSLFDIIFHWLPFFEVCFPMPGLGAQKPKVT